MVDDVEPYRGEDYALLQRVEQKVARIFPEFPEDRLSEHNGFWHRIALDFTLLLLTQDSDSRMAVKTLLQRKFHYN
jgi:hypothetical protein